VGRIKRIEHHKRQNLPLCRKKEKEIEKRPWSVIDVLTEVRVDRRIYFGHNPKVVKIGHLELAAAKKLAGERPQL
jgi:hypothetical protein